MGDPKKHRKKYETPTHPWQAERINQEKELIKEYGLKNKKEIWKMLSILKKFKLQAKTLIPKQTNQAKIEKEQLLNKLSKLNILPKTAQLDNILGLKIEDIMERRLQTIIYKKGLANSPKQARQFITHKHIILNGQKINAPSYLVKLTDETTLEFSKNSPLSDSAHPERISKLKKEISEDKIKEIKKPKTEKLKIKAQKLKTPKMEVPKLETSLEVKK